MTPLYQDHIGLYDYNLQMEWRIVVDIDQIILLNILYMDIETTEDRFCFKDFLSVSSFYKEGDASDFFVIFMF